MLYKLEIKDIFSWFLMLLFILLGVLNFTFIHPVPGIFYLVISIFYCPPLGIRVREKVGFTIAYWIKIIVAFFILWVTLAVGELVEYFESFILN